MVLLKSCVKGQESDSMEGFSSVLSSYKVILFDLDDTLIDFKSSEIESLQLVYENFYRQHTDKAHFQDNFHSINKNLWTLFEQGKIELEKIGTERFKLLSDKLSIVLDPEMIAHFYEENLGSLGSWLIGAEQAIKELKKYYRLGVVTNGFPNVQKAKYKRLSIAEWCQVYIISGEVKVSKPDRRIFEIALEKLDVSGKDVLMVGNSITSDYQGALNAGIDFCWVNHQGDSLPYPFLPPKFVIKSVAQLPQMIISSSTGIMA